MLCAVPLFRVSTRTLVVEQHNVSKAKVPADDLPSFLAPDTPDVLPTTMVKRARVPKNGTLPTNTNETSSCLVTSQVRIIQGRQPWVLESLSIDGKPKTMGGDEYYITYTDDAMTNASSNSPTAVAFVRDRTDGSYALEFVTSPSLDMTATQLSGVGTITIALQYSCGLGHLAPPTKNNWSTGGAISAKYVVQNVTAPRMEPFVPPCCANLGQYDQVVAYGDSTMGHFVGRNLIWPAGNVGAPLNTDTVQNPRETNGKVHPSVVTEIGTHVTRARKQYNRTALIVNSGVWDIIADDEAKQGPQFLDHRKACRQLIAAIRLEFPDIDLYWRSHTAMHIHRVADKKDWYHLDRVFYMSTSRSYDLYRYQKEIMTELNVTFLDLYPATYLSAEHLREMDGRHYSKAFNKKMLDWFYKD